MPCIISPTLPSHPSLVIDAHTPTQVNGVATAFPVDQVAPEEDLLRTVYDCGPIPDLHWETFDELRARVEAEWAAAPPTADVLAPALRAKRVAVAERLGVQGQYRD